MWLLIYYLFIALVLSPYYKQWRVSTAIQTQAIRKTICDELEYFITEEQKIYLVPCGDESKYFIAKQRKIYLVPFVTFSLKFIPIMVF